VFLVISFGEGKEAGRKIIGDGEFLF